MRTPRALPYGRLDARDDTLISGRALTVGPPAVQASLDMRANRVAARVRSKNQFGHDLRIPACGRPEYISSDRARLAPVAENVTFSSCRPGTGNVRQSRTVYRRQGYGPARLVLRRFTSALIDVGDGLQPVAWPA